jgi:hypothetical protein
MSQCTACQDRGWLEVSTASGEAPVEGLVLAQHSFGSSLEGLIRSGEYVGQPGTGQLLKRNAKAFGLPMELLGLGGCELTRQL